MLLDEKFVLRMKKLLGEEGFVAKKLLLAAKGNVFHNTSENVLKFLFLRRYTQKICKILLFRKTF